MTPWNSFIHDQDGNPLPPDRRPPFTPCVDESDCSPGTEWIVNVHILDTLAIIAKFDVQNLDDRSTDYLIPFMYWLYFLP